MIKVSIPYEKSKLDFAVPKMNLCEILEPNRVSLPENEEEEIERAIDNPVGSKKLEKIVKPGDKVIIICEDIARLTPVDRILPLLLNRLNEIGVTDENIKIVMALGSHRPMSSTEMIRKVGENVFKRVKVVNSEFKDKAKLVDLGLAPGGVRVWVDRQVMEGDIRIGVGSIAPHAAAGYTGGGKIVYPGIVGEETVAQFHLRRAFLSQSVLGIVENAVRLEMEKWVDTVGLDFIVNVVITPENKIYKVVTGHYVKAHRIGVKYSQEVYGVRANEKVDIAVVSSFSADQDFWQGTKGIISGELIVRDGGTLILVTPCFEGVGPHKNYPKYIGDDDPDSLLKTATENLMDPKEILSLAVALPVARIRKRLRLVSRISKGINSEEAKEAKFERFNTINEALQEGLSYYGKEAKVSVIPCGGESCPYFGK